jgi:phage terminase Nu1 subunit (DNA packaging protein)
MPLDVNALCTSRELAQVLGVSTRQIDQLVVEKVLKPQLRSGKQRNRRFRLADSVQSFVAYARESVREQSASSNGASAYNDARTRRMNAAALIEEMKARELSGELIKRSVVTNVVTTVLSLTKSRLLAVPNQVMHQLVGRTSPLETNQIVRERIIGALRELAQFDPDTLQRKTRVQKNGRDDSET